MIDFIWDLIVNVDLIQVTKPDSYLNPVAASLLKFNKDKFEKMAKNTVAQSMLEMSNPPESDNISDDYTNILIFNSTD